MKVIAELLPDAISALTTPGKSRMSGALPDRLRGLVRKRDRGTCRYCGRSARTSFREYGEVDHITPCLYGGTDDLENLALACHVCNIRKGGRTPEEAGMSLLPASEVIHG